MSPICGHLFPSYGGSDPKDATSCQRPVNHSGPHRFRCENGKTWRWQTDLSCTCEHCMKAEGDYCVDFWLAPELPSV